MQMLRSWYTSKQDVPNPDNIPQYPPFFKLSSILCAVPPAPAGSSFGRAKRGAQKSTLRRVAIFFSSLIASSLSGLHLFGQKSLGTSKVFIKEYFTLLATKKSGLGGQMNESNMIVMNILDMVFPRVCVGCGTEGWYICEDCAKKIVRPEPICPMCTKNSVGGWTHPRCQSRHGIDRLIVGLVYPGIVQNCLKKVKYKNAWEIISFLFDLWSARVSSSATAELHPGGVVVAVPMWKQKERERGFNQAELIAKLLGKNYKVRNLVILERVRETKPMYGLTKKQRLENVGGAFRIINNQISIIKQKRAILVDDVWTTGSTMRECARALKRAGAAEVWGVTLAR